MRAFPRSLGTAAAAGALAVPLGLLLVLQLDWRSAATPRSPRRRVAFATRDGLEAGAAGVALAPPLPIVRAGYGPPRATAVRERDPLAVRALVLRSGGRALGVALLDVVLVPETLVAEAERRLADLGLDALLVAATHTHSSLGAYDPRVLAQAVGMGRYRRDVEAHLVGRIEAAVRAAARGRVPVRVRTAETGLAGFALNRSTPGAAVDERLTVIGFEAAGGGRVALVAVVSGHPTLVPRVVPELSADYPGDAMRRLERAGGVALLLQGAAGDAALPGAGHEAVARAGLRVAQAVETAWSRAEPSPDRLEFAAADAPLPPASADTLLPPLLRRPGSNLLAPLAPASARVASLRLGGRLLLTLPGEITKAAADELLRSLGLASPSPGGAPRVVGLVQGYVGYIETPERVRARLGESRRVYFGQPLLPALRGGLRAARP